jgi:cell division septal protein FtsQ
MHLSVYRRDNRKRNAREWRRRLLLASSTALFCAWVIAAYSWRNSLRAAVASACSFVFDNAYFAVREIQVRGSDKVGGKEIVAMAGLRQGMNMWKVDPADIEKKIAKHPSVRHVLVRREFPGRVLIEIEERTPKAIVALGKLYYVDADGRVFKEVREGESVDFPLLTGFRAEDLSRPTAAGRKKIQDAVRLSELMAKDSHTLSEIRFDAPDRLIVYTTAYPVALQMGWGDWEDKLKRLDRVLTLWKGNEDRLASLDVSFGDQVVARLRRGSPVNQRNK